ncbi:MAG: immunity 42 family protein [gamma proteobacterium symbiont of Bathyaustriella thionipta]|nr:immunity 42 family protein [gamma proteobacterium symbiont of Bathyaustriella thionipta]
MSVFGEKDRFAIEAMRTRVVDGKPKIRFRMWVDHKMVGDYSQEIDLIDCVNYLAFFISLTNKRYKAELDQLTKGEVFETIYSAVKQGDSFLSTDVVKKEDKSMSLGDDYDLMMQGTEYDNSIFAEFDEGEFSGKMDDLKPTLSAEDYEKHCHVDSIGLESFKDKFNMILVEGKHEVQRLLWRSTDNPQIHEVFLPPKYFEDVGRQFISWAELETGMKLKKSWVRLWKS